MKRSDELIRLHQAVFEKFGQSRSDTAYEDKNRSFDRFHELSAAAESVDNGTYGRCRECSGNIPLARLRVKPEAVRCIRCQEKYETTLAWH